MVFVRYYGCMMCISSVPSPPIAYSLHSIEISIPTQLSTIIQTCLKSPTPLPGYPLFPAISKSIPIYQPFLFNLL